MIYHISSASNGFEKKFGLIGNRVKVPDFMHRQIFTALWLLAIATLVATASPAPTAEKPPLPDDLYFEFKAVPADQNAMIDWRRAAQLEAVPNEKEKQALKFCWTPADREPSADDLAGLQSWLKRDQPALDMFSASLAKPMAQWPERNAQNTQPEIAAFSHLMRARLFAADQLAEQNKFEDAARSLEDSLKLAQMGIEGDPELIHYLLACSARTLTQDAIIRLAARKQVPLPVLERLLNDLLKLDSETNLYSKILRIEFTSDYNEPFDLKKLVADWSKISETNAAMALFPDDCIRPFKVLLDPSLVPFHPKPFDWNADIEATADHYRIYRTNACSAWADRSGEVELENVENRTNLLLEIAPLMKLVEGEPLPLSRQAAQRAKDAYLAIDNPVGRIMNCSLSGFVGSDEKVFKCRTEREATRAVLALLIFERRKGVLPEKLSDLVAEKILKAVPADPFSGGELLYSRERRIVWSVGQDETDDGGKAGETRWSGDDAVWTIPGLN